MSAIAEQEPLAYSIEEVARRTTLSATSVRLAIRHGELPAIRIGRRILIPRAGLETLLSGQHAHTVARRCLPGAS